MYHITKNRHVRLENSRSVVLREGPRGVQPDLDGNPVDLDAGLEKALGSAALARLIEDGTIEVRTRA